MLPIASISLDNRSYTLVSSVSEYELKVFQSICSSLLMKSRPKITVKYLFYAVSTYEDNAIVKINYCVINWTL